MSATPNSCARWHPRIGPSGAPGPGGLGDSIMAVPKIADLQALDTTQIDDGGGVIVKSVFDLWLCDKTKPGVPDGITIVASNDGLAHWFRECLSHILWRTQATWHINPLIGNDENTGTALVPLATFGEWARRVGNEPLLVSQTVTFDNPYTGDCTVRCPTPPGVTLTLQGQRTVLRTSTITNRWNYAAATNQDGRIEDLTIPVSWTASGLVHWLIEILDGAAVGAAGWAVRDMTDSICRHSPLFDETTWTIKNTNVGASYRVVSLTELTGTVRVAADATVTTRYLYLRPVGVDQRSLVVEEGDVTALYCRFEGDGVLCESGGTLDLAACLVLDPDGTAARDGGSVTLSASALESQPTAGRDGTLSVARTSIGQYGATALPVGLLTEDGGHVSVEAPYGVFDQAAAGGSVLDVAGLGSAEVTHYLWGTGNTTNYGLIVRSGGRLTYDPTKLPLYDNPAVADILIGANPGAYAALPLHDATHLCGAVEAT